MGTASSGNNACVGGSSSTMPTLLSAHDLVAIGIPRALAYQLLNRENMPTVRIGKRVFMLREPFMSWLEGHAGGGVSSD